MKYLVMSYNDVDERWVFYGLRDTQAEAEQLAAHVDWPPNPQPLDFRLHSEPVVLEDVPRAQSGNDQYFIFLVHDRSNE